MLPYAAFVSWANLAIRGRFCFLILECFYNQLLTGHLRREMIRISGAATFVPMEKKKKKNPFCTLLLLRKVFYYSSFFTLKLRLLSSDYNPHYQHGCKPLSEQSKAVEPRFLFNWFQRELEITKVKLRRRCWLSTPSCEQHVQQMNQHLL